MISTILGNASSAAWTFKNENLKKYETEIDIQ